MGILDRAVEATTGIKKGKKSNMTLKSKQDCDLDSIKKKITGVSIKDSKKYLGSPNIVPDEILTPDESRNIRINRALHGKISKMSLKPCSRCGTPTRILVHGSEFGSTEDVPVCASCGSTCYGHPTIGKKSCIKASGIKTDALMDAIRNQRNSRLSDERIEICPYCGTRGGEKTAIPGYSGVDFGRTGPRKLTDYRCTRCHKKFTLAKPKN